MNTQELFDKAAGHLLAQNAKSKKADGMCAYRGGEGRMCAVGCLIDADHYDKYLEGQTATDDLIIEAVSDSIGRDLVDQEVELLNRLQIVHDNYTPKSWRERLKEIAQDYGLKFNGDAHGSPH